ncbi:MAG: sensor histidine kinase [Clostridia bacterium]
MKKENLKKVIVPTMLVTIIVIIVFTIILKLQYKNYETIVNNTIVDIIAVVREKYPQVSEEEIISILQNKDTIDKNNENYKIIKKYGYKDNISYIRELEEKEKEIIKVDALAILIMGLIVAFIIIRRKEKHDAEIDELIIQLNKINNGDYELKIEENTEGELSKLRNELYKTTILLKEAAINSEKEKNNLSNSIADISHQLKTPITSIRIMLDNIEENPNMDDSTREEFIEEISKQVNWISSLVISLLKLAKFDAGAIVMRDEKINLNKLIDNVLDNIAILIDVKNINVKKKIDSDIYINADYNWQLEALTNIIKNAIEHSKQGSTIYINVENNLVFTRLRIKDDGEGINKKDIKHIFERFYKGEGSAESSIGIGLSLAKTIIEKENGTIKVQSEKGRGTEFIIEYFKNR